MSTPDILPNCLLKTPKSDCSISAPYSGSSWFYLFCANCGADGGRVMDTFLPAQYAFYLCDECAEKWGEVAGCTATPDDVFQQKVHQAMLEKYGHCLTEIEVLKELDDPSSVISKLEKEGLKR
jgi:hypothetical protein